MTKHGYTPHEARRARQSLGLYQDRHPTVIVYQQGQAEAPAPWSEDDQAKLVLAQLMRDGRRTILGRVNALPGSGASTELWVRYRQIEDAAQALGNKGLWVRALAQFRAGYERLLTAAPVGTSEPIGRGVGHAECPGKCRDCFGCLACQGRRAVDDFVNLMKRLYGALREGERVEAEKIFSRARDVAKKLEPTDATAASVDLAKASAAIDVAASQQGVGRVRGVAGGVGAYSDYFWFVDEVNRAKGDVSKTGDVDGAKRQIDAALTVWQNGPYGVPTGNYQDPETFAANARAYAETFRRGSGQLGTYFNAASGGQQAYYASPEQQRLAAQQREAEKTSLEVARGPFSFMYETAPFVADPTGFASRDDVVSRATGAPAGGTLESVTVFAAKAKDAIKDGSLSSLKAAWSALPTIGKVGVAVVVGYGVKKAVR